LGAAAFLAAGLAAALTRIISDASFKCGWYN
jgi:hypothetical protein